MNRATGLEESGWRLGLPKLVAIPASSGFTHASPGHGAAAKGTQSCARRRSKAGLLFRARSPDGLEISGNLRRSWLSARRAESRGGAAQAHEQHERTASGVAVAWHDGQPDRSEEAGFVRSFHEPPGSQRAGCCGSPSARSGGPEDFGCDPSFTTLGLRSGEAVNAGLGGQQQIQNGSRIRVGVRHRGSRRRKQGCRLFATARTVAGDRRGRRQTSLRKVGKYSLLSLRRRVLARDRLTVLKQIMPAGFRPNRVTLRAERKRHAQNHDNPQPARTTDPRVKGLKDCGDTGHAAVTKGDL